MPVRDRFVSMIIIVNPYNLTTLTFTLVLLPNAFSAHGVNTGGGACALYAI